jgi:hypothetical protein
VYHNAAKHIPKMILVASFSDKAGVKGMQRFLQQWEHAEETLSIDDSQIVDIFDERDRGPFLFWLLNERIFLLRVLLACPSSQPVPYALCQVYTGLLAAALFGPCAGRDGRDLSPRSVSRDGRSADKLRRTCPCNGNQETVAQALHGLIMKGGGVTVGRCCGARSVGSQSHSPSCHQFAVAPRRFVDGARSAASKCVSGHCHPFEVVEPTVAQGPEGLAFFL